MTLSGTLLFLIALWGRNTCNAQNQDSHLLVLYGNDNDAEVLDLSDAPLPCPSPPDFPLDPFGGAGVFFDGAPLVCGGQTLECYSLREQSWQLEPFQLLNEDIEALRHASSSLFSPSSWLVSGGDRVNLPGSESLITEIRSDGVAAPFEVALPFPLQRHNLIRLNDTHLFLVNGEERSANNVFMYEVGSLEWTRMPPIPLGGRSGAFAHVVTRSDGHQEVIVSAGYIYPSYISSTQIFSLSTLTWRDGPAHPYDCGEGATAPVGGTFLTVGGYEENNNHDDLDVIHRYEVEEEEWTEMPARMRRGKRNVVAFAVPGEYCAA